jgi:hypothetical protein
MGQTVGEANAVNTLVRFITQTTNNGFPVPSEESAKEAAKLLLKGSRKTLMAGLNPEEVDVIWKPKKARVKAPADPTYGGFVKEPAKHVRTR